MEQTYLRKQMFWLTLPLGDTEKASLGRQCFPLKAVLSKSLSIKKNSTFISSCPSSHQPKPPSLPYPTYWRHSSPVSLLPSFPHRFLSLRQSGLCPLKNDDVITTSTTNVFSTCLWISSLHGICYLQPLLPWSFPPSICPPQTLSPVPPSLRTTSFI